MRSPFYIDPRCYDLAEYFLEDIRCTGTEKINLAVSIQDCIDDWLNNAERERIQKEDAGDPRAK